MTWTTFVFWTKFGQLQSRTENLDLWNIWENFGVDSNSDPKSSHTPLSSDKMQWIALKVDGLLIQDGFSLKFSIFKIPSCCTVSLVLLALSQPKENVLQSPSCRHWRLYSKWKTKSSFYSFKKSLPLEKGFELHSNSEGSSTAHKDSRCPALGQFKEVRLRAAPATFPVAVHGKPEAQCRGPHPRRGPTRARHGPQGRVKEM